jgi:hypothetical protein
VIRSFSCTNESDGYLPLLTQPFQKSSDSLLTICHWSHFNFIGFDLRRMILLKQSFQQTISSITPHLLIVVWERKSWCGHGNGASRDRCSNTCSLATAGCHGNRFRLSCWLFGLTVLNLLPLCRSIATQWYVRVELDIAILHNAHGLFISWGGVYYFWHVLPDKPWNIYHIRYKVSRVFSYALRRCTCNMRQEQLDLCYCQLCPLKEKLSREATKIIVLNN